MGLGFKSKQWHFSRMCPTKYTFKKPFCDHVGSWNFKRCQRPVLVHCVLLGLLLGKRKVFFFWHLLPQIYSYSEVDYVFHVLLSLCLGCQGVPWTAQQGHLLPRAICAYIFLIPSLCQPPFPSFLNSCYLALCLLGQTLAYLQIYSGSKN